MGNSGSHRRTKQESADRPQSFSSASRRRSSIKSHATSYTPALEKLFQKLELTAETDNGHPGEITRATFENVFHGPLEIFGHLLFRQMVSNGHHSDKIKDRICSEQFVKAGREILKLFDETDQHKYYFRLFSQGKDYLIKDDALTMINVAYALTLSSSMITYSRAPQDDALFEAIVQSMFNMSSEIKFQELEKWLEQHSPHMFCGVHNWVYTILTGSKIPTEMETAPVPFLDKFRGENNMLTMGVLWVLSACLPYMYTHVEKEAEASAKDTKNPLLTSYLFIMKLARLSRCQSWNMLYDSDQHGLSMNRFINHVTGYLESSITLLSFEGRNTYCLAMDQPWKDSSSRMGKADAMLIQLTPVYRVVQSGPSMALWNTLDRNLPKGIQIGQTGKSTVLNIPLDFDHIQHYGVNCVLNKVEVWGCGGTDAAEFQLKQKRWERKEVERAQSKKLHMDVNWDENPDKAILNWGGIEVNHQYSRAGV